MFSELNTATYLDYNATAPLKPEVRARVTELLDKPLNASSVHSFGREARKIIEDSRGRIAEFISVFPREIVFTSSATEANNWALGAFPDRRVLVSAVEHSSVLNASRNNVIPVDANGIVRLEALSTMLAENSNPTLVSIAIANNETGVIQPICDIAELCHKHGALLHTDAVQAFGKIPLDAGLLGADMLTISGHKCGGPVGAAALVVRGNLALPPMLRGGGQELNRRAGTENVAAIAGFAVAAELSPLVELRGWLEAMEKELAVEGAIVFGQAASRLPNISCIAMPGVPQETQLMHFDLAGIAVSAGAACTSGRIEPSHVLLAMGVPKELAGNAIRVSGGWATKKAEIELFATEWKKLFSRKAGQGKQAARS